MTVFEQKHICPERWLFIKKAGVSRLVAQPMIKLAINDAMRNLELAVNRIAANSFLI
jgi:hypothetical protein